MVSKDFNGEVPFFSTFDLLRTGGTVGLCVCVSEYVSYCGRFYYKDLRDVLFYRLYKVLYKVG